MHLLISLPFCAQCNMYTPQSLGFRVATTTLVWVSVWLSGGVGCAGGLPHFFLNVKKRFGITGVGEKKKQPCPNNASVAGREMFGWFGWLGWDLKNTLRKPFIFH